MVNGILLVDKPSGLTSFRVVSEIKRHFNLKKVGHGGTLDPFATGLLIILINRGTKLGQTFLEDDKEYEGTIVLGVKTDTYDIEGKVVSSTEAKTDNQAIKAAVKSFKGNIEQVPPIYSAVKVNGKRAYKLARKGEDIKLKKRDVVIHSIEVTDINEGIHPLVDFKVKVSKGTYIRSLAHDIGERLGVGAHLKNLRRLSSGEFNLKDAKPLDDILKWNQDELIVNLKNVSSE